MQQQSDVRGDGGAGDIGHAEEEAQRPSELEDGLSAAVVGADGGAGRARLFEVVERQATEDGPVGVGR